MLVVVLKFIEVATRAGFVVLTTYTLDLAEAGQFGLIVTIQGLASFAFGYERHIDIQRRMVGEDDAVFDGAVTRALSLFSLNYILLFPIYILSLVIFTKIGVLLLVFCAVIAIGEQLMNQVYQMSLINPRYRSFLFIATGKNIVILGFVVLNLLFGESFTLEDVLIVWVVGSGIAIVISGILFLNTKVHTGYSDGLGWLENIKSQYKASSTHFLLGLVAILTLQFDRLTVGAILPLESTGIYFRHVLLLSLVYQVFNIAFFNRIVPKIYMLAKSNTVVLLIKHINKEYIRVVGFVIIITIIGLFVHWMTDYKLAERFSLRPEYFIGLLVASTLRMRADFNGMIFNARLREKTILKIQLFAFLIGSVSMVVLTKIYGIPGTIVAAILTSLIYLVLNQYSLILLSKEDHQ